LWRGARVGVRAGVDPVHRASGIPPRRAPRKPAPTGCGWWSRRRLVACGRPVMSQLPPRARSDPRGVRPSLRAPC
jgi:hypothetical protein